MTTRPLYVGKRLFDHGDEKHRLKIALSDKANRIADAIETIAAFPDNTPLKVVGPVWAVYNNNPFSAAPKLPPALTRPDTVVPNAVFHNFVDLRLPFTTIESVTANNMNGLMRIRALDQSSQLGLVFMLDYDDLHLFAIYNAEDITVYSPVVVDRIQNVAKQAILARTTTSIASGVSAMAGHGSRENSLDRLTYSDFGWPSPLPPPPPQAPQALTQLPPPPPPGGAKRRRRRVVRSTTTRRRRATTRGW